MLDFLRSDVSESIASVPSRRERWPDTADQELPRAERRLHFASIQALAVAAALISLMYLSWRAVTTIPGATWWLAWPLLLLEAHSVFTFILYAHVLWRPSSVASPAVVKRSPLQVSVLIPTYNEPREVLLPTIAAAAALREANSVWVLDDGGRAWVRELANELNVEYRARATHEHAKAGNINAVLPELRTDLVAVLDADHVVRSDFLANVLGYFDDPKLALVQTPQSFYNTDSFEHVRTLRGRLYCEQDLFYRVLAEARNYWGAAFWCGTNSVVRLSALLEVGGVATETVTEDIHTTLRLHSVGYRTVYHNEVLARGLAASNADQYLSQRMRWGTGAMEVLRLEKPLFSKQLTWHQRLCYASTLLGWFDGWRTLGLILIPLVTVLTGALPARAPMMTFFAVFVSAWLVQNIATQVLGRRRTAWWPSTLFSIIRMPAAIGATLTLARLQPSAFRVTVKGRSGLSRHRMRAPWLLVALLIASGISLCWYIATDFGLTPLTYRIPWVAHAAAGWLSVNAILIATAINRIRSTRFGAERRAAVRFNVRDTVLVDDVPVRVTDLSLTGARLVSDTPMKAGTGISMQWLPLRGQPLFGMIRTVREIREGWALGVEFVDLSLQKQAHLALELFQTGLTPGLQVEREVAHDAPSEAWLQTTA